MSAPALPPPAVAPLPGSDFAAAAEIDAALAALPAVERLRWAWTHFGTGAAIGTSFQLAGIVTLDLAHVHGFALPAFTLDTGLLFPETLALKAQLEARFGQKIESVDPALSVAQQSAAVGPDLWQTDPDLCCHLRKVLPLHERLYTANCWITGLRRDQSGPRAATAIAEIFTIPNTARRIWKLNPLADWTRDQVWDYLRTSQLPVNALVARGYRSIGCWPCTRATAADENERAGRWIGFNKTECGLHSGGSGI